MMMASPVMTRLFAGQPSFFKTWKPCLHLLENHFHFHVFLLNVNRHKVPAVTPLLGEQNTEQKPNLSDLCTSYC